MAKDLESFVPTLRRELRKQQPERILEWGPGKSTQIMHEECPDAEIHTIENVDRYWKKAKREHPYATVHKIKTPSGRPSRYASKPWEEDWGTFDFIFVDGRRRVECLLAARRVVAPDGIVMLHDSDRERYLLGTQLYNTVHDHGHTIVLALKAQKRTVATVADKNIEEHLNRWVDSLRLYGWDGPIDVYAPNNDQPQIDGEATLRPMTPWWESEIDTSLNVSNTTALLKPCVFLDRRFRESDEVLYMDSSDIVVLCDADDIFDSLGSAMLRAVEYPRARVGQHLPDFVIDEFELDSSDEVMRAKHANSGVILARINRTIRQQMQQWKTILGAALSEGPLLSGQGRVGDQVVFSYIFRLLQKHGKAAMLPHEYNYRGGGIEVKKLKVTGGRLMDPDDNEVFVPHATGQHNIPQFILELLK